MSDRFFYIKFGCDSEVVAKYCLYQYYSHNGTCSPEFHFTSLLQHIYTCTGGTLKVYELPLVKAFISIICDLMCQLFIYLHCQPKETIVP